MSAEDELFAIACQDNPVSGTEVREAMDAWAHELAEKIRNVNNWARAENLAPGTITIYQFYGRRAAAVIDPEK
jgi:hypothetical protein